MHPNILVFQERGFYLDAVQNRVSYCLMQKMANYRLVNKVLRVLLANIV